MSDWQKKKKVLLVGDYPPPYGGIATHIVSLDEGLRNIEIETQVLDIGSNRKVTRPNCLPTKGYVDYVKKVIFFLRKGYLVHLHTNGHNTKSWFLVFISSLLGQIFNSSIVTTFHSGILPSYFIKASFFHKFIAYLSCRMCGEIICVSSEIKTAISQLIKNDNKLKVIPAFMGGLADGVRFSTKPAQFIRDHSPVISTVAHFLPEYGIPLVLNAAYDLKKSFGNLGLLIVGEGDSSEEIEKQIQLLSLDNNVLILKSLEHGECLYVIKHSDLFLRPSYIDGDSIAVREAIYLGTPVLASDVVNRPPEVNLFKSGDLNDLEEKTYQMLAEKTKNSMGIRKNVNDNNLPEILNAYQELFPS